MSVLTIAVLVLIAVVVLGLIAVTAEEYAARFGRAEAYRISTRDLPNIAVDIAAEIGAPDRDTTRR